MEKKGSGVHIRRCHMCGAVTEREGALVEKCRDCGKPMAPFYYFDDRRVPICSEMDLRPRQHLGERSPVRGLTAFW